MSRKVLIFILLLIGFMVFYGFNVLAAENTDNDELGIDLTVQGLVGIITGLACWLIRASLALMVIFLIIAGIRFFTAGGDTSKQEAAKKNLTWTIIGIFVILAVNVIIATIANALGRDYSFIPLKCESVTSEIKYQ